MCFAIDGSLWFEITLEGPKLQAAEILSRSLLERKSVKLDM